MIEITQDGNLYIDKNVGGSTLLTITENSSAKNLTGLEFVCGIARSYSDSPLLFLSSEVENASAGQVRISITKEQSNLLDDKKLQIDKEWFDAGRWCLYSEDSSGRGEILAGGRCVLRRSI